VNVAKLPELLGGVVSDSEKIKKYPFPEFPAEWEKDKHVFFHGTKDTDHQSIIEHGFLSAAEQAAMENDKTEASDGAPRQSTLTDFARGPLLSVSFFDTSRPALGHACKSRSTSSPCGCVFAVRYDCLKPDSESHDDCLNIKRHVGGMDDYKRDPQRTILGYYIVPEGYSHV
jgi:hypothetical protein